MLRKHIGGVPDPILGDQGILPGVGDAHGKSRSLCRSHPRIEGKKREKVVWSFTGERNYQYFSQNKIIFSGPLFIISVLWPAEFCSALCLKNKVSTSDHAIQSSLSTGSPTRALVFSYGIIPHSLSMFLILPSWLTTYSLSRLAFPIFSTGQIFISFWKALNKKTPCLQSLNLPCPELDLICPPLWSQSMCSVNHVQSCAVVIHLFLLPIALLWATWGQGQRLIHTYVPHGTCCVRDFYQKNYWKSTHF